MKTQARLSAQSASVALATIAAKAGKWNLIAGAALVIGWFLLTTLSIQIPIVGAFPFTFWQVLGLLNASSFLESMDRGFRPGAGIYGLFALIALVAPFVHLFWKNKRMALAGALPLAFMLFVWAMVRHAIASAFGGDDAGEFGRQAAAEMMGQVSSGAGAYLSALAGVYFAVNALRFHFQPRAPGLHCYSTQQKGDYDNGKTN
jgi:hypothetical protein